MGSSEFLAKETGREQIIAIKSGVDFLKKKEQTKTIKSVMERKAISPNTFIKQYPKRIAKREAEQNSSVKSLNFNPFIKKTLAPEVKIKVDKTVQPKIASLIGNG